MIKSLRLFAPIAAAALIGCGTTPLEVPAVEARLEGEGGCVSLSPSVTVEQAPDQLDPAREGPVRFTVSFTLPVSGFETDDLIIGGTAGRGAIAHITAVDAQTYIVELSGLTRNGKISLAVKGNAAEAPQLCNNLSAPSTSVDNVVLFLGKSR